MQGEIKRIHREVGITMIYVTHDQTEAMSMSDRIAVFSRGRLEQIGKPLEIYHRPQTRFVGEFVGDSNFFRGRVEASEPGTVAVEGLGPIKVSPEKLRRVGSAPSVDVMVRPERLRVMEESGEGMNALDMTIDTVVNYGDSLMVVGHSGKLPLRMRLSGQAPELVEGRSIRVGWTAEEAHLVAGP
jgi:putative spermidine/putrescine transport system ATP-binding protein